MDYSDNRILRRHTILGFQNNLNLKQIIESHTRVTNTTRTMIDLIFTDTRHILSAGIIDYSLSDHFPICMIKK